MLPGEDVEDYFQHFEGVIQEVDYIDTQKLAKLIKLL